jgi:hypothetical protein
MTQLEAVVLIGNVLTEIDVAIGSLMPSDPRQRQLLDLRLLLDERQRRLAREVFDTNTEAFQQAAEELTAINNSIRGTIRDVANLTQTIQNVTRFLGAVTNLLGAAGL